LQVHSARLARILPTLLAASLRGVIVRRRVRQWGRVVLGLVPIIACQRLPVRSSGKNGTIEIISGNRQAAPLRRPLPQSLTVGVFDGAHTPVAGARVGWVVTYGGGTLSSDTTTSLPSGMSQVNFTVPATPGIDSVRATLMGTAKVVTFGIVAGASSGPWPKEPAGFTMLTDWSYDQLVTSATGSWLSGTNVWNQTRGTGLAAIVSDPGAPLSPPNVAQITYPIGLPSGTEPWTLYFDPAPAGREYYTAFWWKASTPWQGDVSGINKISFWQDAAPSSANLIVMLNNQAKRGYRLTVTLEFHVATNGHLANVAGYPGGTVWHLFGNVNGGNYVIVPGSWYRIELYFKGSTTPTSQDGIVRLWATKLGDAAPTAVSNYTTANFDTPNFIQFEFAPTWGGSSGVKTETDYYWIDHVHLSRP
jgi:hypothetical protein